jgi:hypothetical protein
MIQFYVTAKILIKVQILSECWVIPAMASTPLTPAGPTTSQSLVSQPETTLHANRPLQREGAVVFLSAAEQALEDAMSRSSPPPESLLGKRTHEQDDEQEGADTDPEDGSPSATQGRSLAPSLGNLTAATLRYATFKKLRAEQRDELEVFLKVRTYRYILVLPSQHWPGHGTGPSSQIVCLRPLG